jgi:hypothetical protein
MSRVLAKSSLRGTFISVQPARVFVGDIDTTMRDPVLQRRRIEHDDARRDADMRHLASTHHAAQRADWNSEQLRRVAIVQPRRHDATAFGASGTTFALAASASAGT